MPSMRDTITTVTTTTTDFVPAASTLLQLMWLASPALPVGGFSYSEALESAVDTGRVADEARASEWLLDQLQLGLARSDVPVAGEALQAWQRGDLAAAAALNDWITTTARPTSCCSRRSRWAALWSSG